MERRVPYLFKSEEPASDAVTWTATVSIVKQLLEKQQLNANLAFVQFYILGFKN